MTPFSNVSEYSKRTRITDTAIILKLKIKHDNVAAYKNATPSVIFQRTYISLKHNGSVHSEKAVQLNQTQFSIVDTQALTKYKQNSTKQL